MIDLLKKIYDKLVIINTNLSKKYTEIEETTEYTYIGTDNADYVPVPYGWVYPINQYWGYDYNFVTEVYINNTLLEKDSDWREANGFECNGFKSSTGSYNQGQHSISGFAHSIILLTTSVYYGDLVTMKIKRRINNIKILDLRAGELAEDTATYRYGKNVNGTPVEDYKFPQSHIKWNYPKDDDLKIILFAKHRYHSGQYNSMRNPGTGAIHQGQNWRVYKVIDSIDGYYHILQHRNHTAYKLAVFNIKDGSIGDMTTDTIIRKWNNRWSYATAGPLNQSIVIK